MQKTSLKASILIWATFLSLIITVTFISISTKINKNLKNNSNLTEQLEINNEIQNILKNKGFENQFLTNGEQILFDNLKEKYINLKKEEIIKLKFEQTNEVTITGSTLYYSGTTSTGIINDNITFSTGSGFLYLTNLGGYSKVHISSTGTIIEEYINYKIIKNIGNKTIIKSRGLIKNF